MEGIVQGFLYAFCGGGAVTNNYVVLLKYGDMLI